MSRPSKTDSNLPRSPEIDATIANAAPEPTMQEIGGTRFRAFNLMLVRQAIASYSTAGAPTDDPAKSDAMLTGMLALAPKDAQEGMLAAQMLGLHNAAMECLRRSALDGQTFDGRQANLTQAAKLSRTYALLVETRDRHRGGGTQKIIVERVTVNAGGQAIVGAITHTREGADEKLEEQPHAKQLAYAPVCALPGLDAPSDALPVTSDAQRAVPHARRAIPRRTDG